MIIEKNISHYIVHTKDRLSSALSKIDLNKHRFILAVDDEGVLVGVLTDGDFRRWILSEQKADLSISVEGVINKDFFALSKNLPKEQIEKHLSQIVEFIPLIDEKKHLVGIARKRDADLVIGNYKINKDSRTFVIAEIGNNHNGKIETAKKLVDKAIIAGAVCVKLQMRDMDTLYVNEGKADDESADLGAQYTLDLLSKFQLSTHEMLEVFDYCKDHDILPLCTPFDEASLAILENYGMEAYKLASADLTNHDLIRQLAETGKPLICSTGMSSEEEIISAITLLKKYGSQYILLLCNSTYPAPFKDINLKYMDHLKQLGNCFVGYSGHERGINIPLAAVSLGAKVIEKHFTLDKSWEGNDHKVSLLPDEFKQMVSAIREIEQALGESSSRVVSQGEMMNREVLGKSLAVNCDIQSGDLIKQSMITVKSPGKGIPPYYKKALIGRKAKRDLKSGDFFFMSDLNEDSIKPRQYKFNRHFGIPVRYHDLSSMLPLSNFNLVEFHLSYRDLEVDLSSVLNKPYDIDFVVHSPELFSGDHILDLCSFDENYRQHSIQELQKTINITRCLKDYFPKTKRPLIIVNVGGSTQNDHLGTDERKRYYDQLKKSLTELDRSGIEIIPQTMPPFPWHFGGQRYQNLFIDPHETALFCKHNGMRICLDVSHSKLACNYFKWPFSEFIKTLSPYTAHLHLVDAEGVDSEGLQIGEGTIDFQILAQFLNEYAPDASFIPEIWQGHKNDGEGFWVALEKLERWF